MLASRTSKRFGYGMELTQIHNTFHRWVNDLQEQGMYACFSHDLEAEPPQDKARLLVSAVLLTARSDPERLARGTPRRRPPTRPLALLRYLIAIDSPARGIEREQALLHLMVRAQRTAGMTVLCESPSTSLWLAWGVAPRPAFLLDVCVSQTMEVPAAPPVREVRLDLCQMRSVHGRVVAADATPVAGAEIQLLATGQMIRSDRQGAFHFQVGEPEPGGSFGRLRVRARGVEAVVDIPGAFTSEHPWLVRIDPLNDDC